jgi:hypothetical protein
LFYFSTSKIVVDRIYGLHPKLGKKIYKESNRRRTVYYNETNTRSGREKIRGWRQEKLGHIHGEWKRSSANS